ncbi:MAG: peptidoglycan editing factor PgeF [Tannerellaceae bacterium]|nr:peptidoglycan editing factor PgeF [Tannerellaceae bacterium]
MTGTVNAGLQFSNLSACKGLSHFVTACSDAGTLSSRLGISRVYVSQQVHSDRIAIVNSRTEDLIGYDALITAERNICIAVSTADCVPVLLYSPDRSVSAAVHAGWRGTVLKIVSKVARLMTDEFDCDPKLMLAGIAPSIGMSAFEVGNEVTESFQAAGIDISQFSQKHTDSGKIHIDLKKANLFQLLEEGLIIENIEVSDICTYSNAGNFFSVRRQGISCGRMLTGMFMEGKK